MQIRRLVTSQCGHKVVYNRKKLNISHVFFCIELKLRTVVTLITKLHNMSTMIFPWQHNGLQALSVEGENQSFPPSRSVICYCCSFSGCESIRVSEYQSTYFNSDMPQKQQRHVNNSRSYLFLFGTISTKSGAASSQKDDHPSQKKKLDSSKLNTMLMFNDFM